MKDKVLIKLKSLVGEAIEMRSTSINLDECPDYGDLTDKANEAFEIAFQTFRISSLTFLEMLLGEKHLYYNDFKNKVTHAETYNVEYSIALLKKLIVDIEDGWLLDFKSLLSAEIFNDFLDMAEHLLDESYKDASAVIIGSVFEENLRQVCLKEGVTIQYKDFKRNKILAKPASMMNDDLYKAKVYNLNVQKAVIGWLAIRNSAAHGQYTEYDEAQVRSLLSSVRDFSARFLS